MVCREVEHFAAAIGIEKRAQVHGKHQKIYFKDTSIAKAHPLPASSARGVQAMMRTLLGISVATVAFVSLASAAEPVKVDVVFSGLWWTEEQVTKWAKDMAADMERAGRQVDTPLPPKETRTILKEWHSGDMMPPNPEVVDVDVTVTVQAAVKEPVEVSYQYEEKGRLTAPVTLVRSGIDLAPGAAQVLHGSINLYDYIKHEHFPKFIKITARIGKQPPVTAKLPIVLEE
jgi:hypothetical protein